MKVRRLTSLAVATALVGACQTLVLTTCFGVDRQIETFFVASAVISSFIQLSMSGRIGEMFIPVYLAVKLEDGPRARRLNTLVLLGMIAFAVAVTAVGWIGARPLARLLAPGFSASDHHELAWMIRLLTPCLVLQLSNANLATLAQAEKHFLWPDIGRLGGRIVNLVAIAGFYHRLGIWCLPLGYWLSNMVDVAASSIACWRSGYRFDRPRRGDRSSLGSIARSTPASILAIVALEIYNIGLNSILSSCPPGTLAIYNYGRRITIRLTGVIIRPAAIVFLSQFGTFIAKDLSTVALMNRAMELLLNNSGNVVVATVASCPYLLSFIFGPGVLSPVEMRFASQLFITLACCYFAKGPGVIARKACVGLGRATMFYTLESVARIVCILLAWVLIRLGGNAGIVTAVGVTTAIRTACGFLPLVDKPDYIPKYSWASLLRCGLAMVTALLMTRLVSQQVDAWMAPVTRLSFGVYAGLFGSLAVAIAYVVSRIIDSQLRRLAGRAETPNPQ